MEIKAECPNEWTNDVLHHVCPYHQRFPAERNYAGCTCSHSIGHRKKRVDELTEADHRAIAIWNKVQRAWLDAPIVINEDGTPIR